MPDESARPSERSFDLYYRARLERMRADAPADDPPADKAASVDGSNAARLTLAEGNRFAAEALVRDALETLDRFALTLRVRDALAAESRETDEAREVREIDNARRALRVALGRLRFTVAVGESGR